jgi:hypothetical protein
MGLRWIICSPLKICCDLANLLFPPHLYLSNKKNKFHLLLFLRNKNIKIIKTKEEHFNVLTLKVKGLKGHGFKSWKQPLVQKTG